MHELRGDTVLGNDLGVIAFGEEATVIAEAGGGDDGDTGERGLINYYRQFTTLDCIYIISVVSKTNFLFDPPAPLLSK